MRKFTLPMDAKSVIISVRRAWLKGWVREVKGVAWSTCGDRSGGRFTDGAKPEGRATARARLRIAFTRFHFPWNWDGSEARLVSRCTDETGYVQPSKEELIAVRGVNSNYHYNGTKLWKVAADGSVSNV